MAKNSDNVTNIIRNAIARTPHANEYHFDLDQNGTGDIDPEGVGSMGQADAAVSDDVELTIEGAFSYMFPYSNHQPRLYKDSRVAILDTGGKKFPTENLLDVETNEQEIVTDNFSGGHGSEVEAIIDAFNRYSWRGTNSKISILNYKIANQFGVGTDWSLLRGLCKALANKAKVVNLSYGSFFVSPLIAKAIKVLNDNFVFLVVAAGNTREMVSKMIGRENQPRFPANLDQVGGVIAVSAPSSSAIRSPCAAVPDKYATDATYIDVYAPGHMNGHIGTSFSAAFVSGVLATEITQVNYAEPPPITGEFRKAVLNSTGYNEECHAPFLRYN